MTGRSALGRTERAVIGCRIPSQIGGGTIIGQPEPFSAEMQRGHVDEAYPPVSALSPTPELPDPFETFDGRTVSGAPE